MSGRKDTAATTTTTKGDVVATSHPPAARLPSEGDKGGGQEGEAVPLTGGYDYELDLTTSPAGSPSRFECPVCLLCLREPTLTPCGHRFCKGCITQWILKEGKRCPLDGSPLALTDLYADNCTRREILQSPVRCPFAGSGCTLTLPLVDMDTHVQSCTFKRDVSAVVAVDALADCYYRGVGCPVRLPPSTLRDHLEHNAQLHLNLLTSAYRQLSAAMLERESSEPDDYQFRRQRSWDCGRVRPKMSGTMDPDRLLKEMYQRLVRLEQKATEHQIRLAGLSSQMESLAIVVRQQSDAASRCCMGHFVWQAVGFSQLSSGRSLFSPHFYIHPYGHSVCLRINLHPSNNPTHLSVFVHLCRTSHDAALTWPFVGRVHIRLVNADQSKSMSEEVRLNGGTGEAFQRPVSVRNAKGYGFPDFAPLEVVRSGGYLVEDVLTLEVDAEEGSSAPSRRSSCISLSEDFYNTSDPISA